MTQLDEALASPEWAFALAETLERQLGDDRILTVGTARDRLDDIAGSQPVRTLGVRFTTADGGNGAVVLVAFPAFAEALERAASDELLLSACTGAFEAAVRVIGEQAVTTLNAEAPDEIDADALADEPVEAESVYPLLDGSELLGVVALRVDSDSATGPAGSAGADSAEGPPIETMPVPGSAPYVLADVEMGVTAELGRCRMTVRELLSITPGAVIDLDRPAGAPVDVLVNGTLIARGEVVVIDEEFGIRISELIPQPAAR